MNRLATRLRSLALFLAGGLAGTLGWGCGAAPGSTTDALVEAGAPSLLDSCSGKYDCVGPGVPYVIVLSKREDGCYADDVRLPPEGSGISDGVMVTWSGDASGWDVTESYDGGSWGRHCTPEADESSASPAGSARCTGTPDPCSWRTLGYNCDDGCDMDSSWNGVDWDNECEGTPDACAYQVTQESCTKVGCQWQ